MSDLTECPICLERYDKTNKMPKILNCGHTFCKDCLIKQNDKYKKIECSICRENQTINDPNQLITNRTIFDLLYNPKIEEDNISENYDNLYLDKLDFKIIMIGPAGSGKTSLVRRYILKKFDETYNVTIGFDFSYQKLKIGKKEVGLQIWDTAGTELFQSLTSSYYRNSFGALAVFDVQDRKNFESMDTWIKYYREHRDENKEELIYLIGNKIDLSKERVVAKEEALNFIEKNKLKNYFETSAKTGYNIDKIFNSIAKDLLEIYGKKLNFKNIDNKKVKLNEPIQRNKKSKCKKC